MEVLERYIQAVRTRLPWDRQDDIAAELRTNLQAQLEEKESELGRSLTDDEAEAWIGQLGSPYRMADQYRPVRYLIGPELYSNYLLVLRTALSWVLALSLFFGAFSIAAAYPQIGSAFLAAMRQLSRNLFDTAIVVTLIFATIEFLRVRRQGQYSAASSRDADWSPRSLPPLEIPSAGGAERRNRGRVIVSLVFGCLGLAWLVMLPHYPYLIIGPGARYLPSFPFAPTPTLTLVYWLIVGQVAVAIAWRMVALFTDRWRWLYPAEVLVLRLLGLASNIVALTAPQHQLIQLARPAGTPEKYATMLPTLNELFYKLAVLFFAITVLQLTWQLARMTIAWHRRRAAGSTSPAWPDPGQ
jgi:hypothetical protein